MGSCCLAQGAQPQRSAMACRGGRAEREAQQGGDTCIVDSLCCTSGTNVTMCIDYTTIKKEKEG